MAGSRIIHGLPVTSQEFPGATFFDNSIKPVLEVQLDYAQSHGLDALGTYVMTQNGNGSWAADSAGALDDGLTASATYQGEATQDVSLQLSHCNTYSHYQIDFSSSAVLTPPWFKGITPNPLITSDAQ